MSTLTSRCPTTTFGIEFVVLQDMLYVTLNARTHTVGRSLLYLSTHYPIQNEGATYCIVSHIQ